MDRIEISGLNDLKRSVDNIAKNLDKSFNEIYENSRHRDNLKIQTKQLEIQERQISILDEQTKLSKRQTEFSRSLMLATLVLAIGAFLQTIIQILNMPSENYSKLMNSSGIVGLIIFGVGTILLVSLMGGIIYLVIINFKKR